VDLALVADAAPLTRQLPHQAILGVHWTPALRAHAVPEIMLTMGPLLSSRPYGPAAPSRERGSLGEIQDAARGHLGAVNPPVGPGSVERSELL
jgi:hypothetical protein